MISGFLTRLFGSRNERVLKQYQRTAEKINALEPGLEELSDEALRAKTAEFRQRLADGATLDELLAEAFAVVREASKRTLGMRHFDVQLIGGMVLHAGKISEQRTGEGKTLTATLPVYLNALAGKGVHIVTVNDYLVTRDAEWMGRIYRFLGMTVGTIVSQQDTAEKRQAYAADITYGTNNEFGFDYLRDNMEHSLEEKRQRGLNYAIVDEVDSILIDEARTPLIISGPAEDHTDLYTAMNEVPPLLTRQADEKAEGDFWVDEKSHQVHVSEAGHEKIESILVRKGLLGEGESLYAPQNIVLMHHLNAALRAHHLFHRDQHYVIQNGEVIIVDEFTGRLMPGRRWSEGLHQAVEAKEKVKIQSENQTYASITFQNYFRMYEKLAGMTGTADTEAYEFQEIYRLETVVIPTHRPMVRLDQQDKIYRTVKEKHAAIVADVKDCYERGQPVLLGTTSIENSELLSQLLRKEGLPHQVLNAKQHAKEAEIVAQAGRPRMITIATNMAGRGTDIVLGGNVEKQVQFVEADEALDAASKEARIAKLRGEWQSLHDQVVAAGGLKIIGSERHESRRIDNQLRGRSGRQGDPGSSRFYLSLDDSLMRIFAPDWVTRWMKMFGMKEDEALEDRMVTRVIEKAQRKVEAHNFDIRKNLLEYDDVANDQRKVIYEQRNELLEATDVAETTAALRRDVVESTCRQFVPENSIDEQWDLPALERALESDFGIRIDTARYVEGQEELAADQLWAKVQEDVDRHFREKEAQVGSDVMRQLEKHLMLQVLDAQWKDHLASMDYLRQGIHLRGYAQKQPKQEYKREAFELFGGLIDRVRADVVKILMNVKIETREEIERAEQRIEAEAGRRAEAARAQHSEFGSALAAEAPDVETLTLPESAEAKPEPIRRFGDKIGRNDPCPCGSGKKYKQCHGKLA